MKYLILLFLVTPLAAADFCILGDVVRLRSKPSLQGEVLREYYHGTSFDSAVAQGPEITIGGQTGRWLNVSRRFCAISCSEQAGYIFSPFVTSCNEANEKLRARLLNPALPLSERVAYRIISISMNGDSGATRLLPGGKSSHTGDEYILSMCDSGCIHLQIVWSEKNAEKNGDHGRLIVNYTASMNYRQPKWTKRFTCEYSGVRTDEHEGLELIPANGDPNCRAKIR
ncbi:MAG: hypothetical protein JNM27_16020 [Leptospirales bacterium]|nr:hypothetical protein [Leptospirales bacterium]